MIESDELILKQYEMIDIIKSDLCAADLKITLFMIACQSSKLPNESLFKTNCNAKHRCSLTMMNYIPGVPKLLYVLRNPKVYVFDQLALEILYWLIVVNCDPKITTVPSESSQEILEFVSGDQLREMKPYPDHIFKINYCPSSEYSRDWELKKAQNTIKYGYQPIRLQDCFTKLFCNPQFITKNKAYSISKTLKEALKQTCFNRSWCRSMLGFNIKIIILVEFIEQNLKGTKLSCKTIFCGKNSIADSVITRYSYLLVYKEKISKPSSKSKKYAIKFLIIALLFGLISIVISRCYNKQCTFTF